MGRLDTRGAYPIFHTAYVKITRCILRRRNNEIRTMAEALTRISVYSYAYYCDKYQHHWRQELKLIENVGISCVLSNIKDLQLFVFKTGHDENIQPSTLQNTIGAVAEH